MHTAEGLFVTPFCAGPRTVSKAGSPACHNHKRAAESAGKRAAKSAGKKSEGRATGATHSLPQPPAQASEDLSNDHTTADPALIRSSPGLDHSRRQDDQRKAGVLDSLLLLLTDKKDDKEGEDDHCTDTGTDDGSATSSDAGSTPRAVYPSSNF